jgi:hypothetical protein
MLLPMTLRLDYPSRDIVQDVARQCLRGMASLGAFRRCVNLTPPLMLQGDVMTEYRNAINYNDKLHLHRIENPYSAWSSDLSTLSRLVAAYGHTLDTTVATDGISNAPFLAGRIRNSMPHCATYGALCNPMGRLVQFDVRQLGTSLKGGGVASGVPEPLAAADVIMNEVWGMPWVVQFSLADTRVGGALPVIGGAGPTPPLVRLIQSPCPANQNLSLLQSVSSSSRVLHASYCGTSRSLDCCADNRYTVVTPKEGHRDVRRKRRGQIS